MALTTTDLSGTWSRFSSSIEEKSRLAREAATRKAEEELQKREAAEARRKLLAELGLEPAVKIMGLFWVTESAIDRMKGSLAGVIGPSLVTKVFGRAAILYGIVNYATILTFIVSNLLFVAPFVALLAGAVRFITVLALGIYRRDSLNVILRDASKEALKTAVKFFVVYMVWVLAVALATHLAIMSGPLMPLGILLVGVLTSLGFAFASFLVDTLPDFLTEPKKNWALFVKKLKGLEQFFLPASFEGATWTLMDVVVRVSTHIAGGLGKALDMVGITLVVAAAFFTGAVIHTSLKRWYTLNRASEKIWPERARPIDDAIERLVRSIKTGVLEGPAEHLRKISEVLQTNQNNDPRLMTAIVEYVQTFILLNAIKNALVDQRGRIQATDLLADAERQWVTHLPVSLVFLPDAKKTGPGQLTKLENLVAQRAEAQKALKATKAPKEQAQAWKKEAQTLRSIKAMEGTVVREQEKSFQSLHKKHGLFRNRERHSYRPDLSYARICRP